MTTAPTLGSRARRELAIAVVLSAIGGGLALFAASRQWWVAQTPRPAPLPPLTETVNGRDAAPWLSAMGFMALAGSAALLATRRIGRMLVGLLLIIAGVATTAGGAIGLSAYGIIDLHADATTGQYVHASLLPPSLAVCAGALVACAGLLVGFRFRLWQTERAGLGTRYDSPVSTRATTENPADPALLWNALDRGHDPTIDRA